MFVGVLVGVFVGVLVGVFVGVIVGVSVGVLVCAKTSCGAHSIMKHIKATMRAWKRVAICKVEATWLMLSRLHA